MDAQTQIRNQLVKYKITVFFLAVISYRKTAEKLRYARACNEKYAKYIIVIVIQTSWKRIITIVEYVCKIEKVKKIK